MTERTKFILKVIGFITACILIALAIYFTFFHRATTVTIENGGTTSGTTGGLPTANNGTGGTSGSSSGSSSGNGSTSLPPSKVANGGNTITTLLTNTKVLSPTVTASGSVAYYDPADGKFYTMTPTETSPRSPSKRSPKRQSVTFDTGATEAVIEYPDGSNVVYNFDTANKSHSQAIGRIFRSRVMEQVSQQRVLEPMHRIAHS